MEKQQEEKVGRFMNHLVNLFTVKSNANKQKYLI